MFKFLKDKIGKAIKTFSASKDDVKEELAKEEPAPPKRKKEVPDKKPKIAIREDRRPATTEPVAAEPVHEKEEPRSLFTKLSHRLTTIQLSEEKFDELFWNLELALMENNVALSVIEKIKGDLRDELTTGRTARGNLQERILRRLEESLRELFNIDKLDLIAEAEKHKPLVIVGVGVNGSGKTTTLAKLGKYFKDHGKSVVLAASDTFRAAAIQQLEEHAKRLKVPLIKQGYGSDAAAVAYDAVQHAKAKGIDVVLIDTAGRLHSNSNLMDELAKVVRVAKPQHVLFVGESITGNDCVEQAKQFSEHTPIDGIILTKADVDEKGGAAISIGFITGKPILFLGVGQDYGDLEAFSADKVISQVLPS